MPHFFLPPPNHLPFDSLTVRVDFRPRDSPVDTGCKLTKQRSLTRPFSHSFSSTLRDVVSHLLLPSLLCSTHTGTKTHVVWLLDLFMLKTFGMQAWHARTKRNYKPEQHQQTNHTHTDTQTHTHTHAHTHRHTQTHTHTHTHKLPMSNEKRLGWIHILEKRIGRVEGPAAPER